MKICSMIMIFTIVGSVFSDNIGWNRLSNNVNNHVNKFTVNAMFQPMNADQYNMQMLRHLIKKDQETYRKFLEFLQNQYKNSAQ